ncbi:MAG: hypothetical protein KC416_14335, partial [Myxococcales bacterium]|nr:hypothetical protein [Myxococcales bacterium]
AAEHDCCIEVAVQPGALPSDPQHRARRMFIPTEGKGFPQPQTPFRTLDVASPSPAQGEHSATILTEVGLTPEEIQGLREAGVVRMGATPGPGGLRPGTKE